MAVGVFEMLLRTNKQTKREEIQRPLVSILILGWNEVNREINLVVCSTIKMLENREPTNIQTKQIQSPPYHHSTSGTAAIFMLNYIIQMMINRVKDSPSLIEVYCLCKISIEINV